MAAGSMSFRDLRQEMMRLYTEEKFDAALEVVEQHAAGFPQEAVIITFWRVCLMCRSARPEDAMSALREGLDRGFWWHESVFHDSDLDTVRELPEFKRLVGVSREQYERAKAGLKPERILLAPEGDVEKHPLLITLHGRGANMQSHLEHWEAARLRGWLVLSLQSAQPLFPGAFCWDDPVQSLRDISSHFEDVLRSHVVDTERVILSGFSQGGGMGLYAALSGEIPARGFIGIAPGWEDLQGLAELAARGNKPRAYFVSGEQDQGLARNRAIQDLLRVNDVPVYEELHSDIGHEFPSGFARSFEKAIKFIF